MDASKKIINAMSDNRFQPETLATNLLRQPLETQEMFIYSFIRYIYAVNSYARMGMLGEEMEHIKSWTQDLAGWFDNHLTT